MLTYEIVERDTGRKAKDLCPNSLCALTPAGEIIWWDESLGWEVDEYPGRWCVKLLSYDSLALLPKVK